MSTINAHLPNGTLYQQAAAWELIVASILIAAAIFYRCYHFRRFNNSITSVKDFFTDIMLENSLAHTIMYVVIFALVFSAALSFFIG